MWIQGHGGARGGLVEILVIAIKMLEGMIKYAERSGAKFITAYELARLSAAEFLNNNVDYDNQPDL